MRLALHGVYVGAEQLDVALQVELSQPLVSVVQRRVPDVQPVVAAAGHLHLIIRCVRLGLALTTVGVAVAPLQLPLHMVHNTI